MVSTRVLIEAAASILSGNLKIELALLIGDILLRAFTELTPEKLNFFEWIFLANNCQIALLCLFHFRELILLIFFAESISGVKHLKIISLTTCLATINFSVVYVSWKGLETKLSYNFFVPTTAVLILVLCFAKLAQQGAALRRRRLVREDDEEARIGSINPTRQTIGLTKKFRHDELVAATGNFATPIGRGGSGTVFVGVIDGSPVAVKRLETERRGDGEFWSEITAIANVQHTNIVRLIGYCLVTGAYRYIVYEFIENGSLDAWIFPGSEKCLTWAQRYQVAIHVAKALAYVHHDCRSQILHLDLKPDNILLDRNFIAYVSDFGVSRLMGKEESTVFGGDVGTRGYLAPERLLGGRISAKSDVYSYGLVLLEIVGGRKNMPCSEIGRSYFPKIVDEKMREDELMEVVDERLLIGEGVDEEELKVLVRVALWCIQHKAEDRPSMERVVEMLQGHVQAPFPPETRMFMVEFFSSTRVDENWCTSGGACMSVNSCALSTQVGR